MDPESHTDHTNEPLSPALFGQPESTNTRHAYNFLLWSLLLLIAYVLSTGPVVKLATKGLIARHTVLATYAPLVYLDQHCPPFRAFNDWYLDNLWRVRWGNSPPPNKSVSIGVHSWFVLIREIRV